MKFAERREIALGLVDRALECRDVGVARLDGVRSRADLPASVASSLPRLKSASCVHASHASSRAARASRSGDRGRSAARATPIALESSSSVP